MRFQMIGLSGDSLSRMIDCVDMIASVTPEKVFILGGINSLTDSNSEIMIEQYRELIEAMRVVCRRRSFIFNLFFR